MTSSWGTTGTLTRAADEQRRRDLRRQRELEREEVGRVVRGRRSTRHDDEHAEAADTAPPGWARSGR